jgi:hypothetical protein
MMNDYHYMQLLQFFVMQSWVRCLLERVTVCKTAAAVPVGSSPTAPTEEETTSGCKPAARRPVLGTGGRAFESRRPDQIVPPSAMG